jgi:hypothetical protein
MQKYNILCLIKANKKHFEKKRKEPAQKRKPARENVHRVRTPVYLAQKMGKSVGGSQILLR